MYSGHARESPTSDVISVCLLTESQWPVSISYTTELYVSVFARLLFSDYLLNLIARLWHLRICRDLIIQIRDLLCMPHPYYVKRLDTSFHSDVKGQLEMYQSNRRFNFPSGNPLGIGSFEKYFFQNSPLPGSKMVYKCLTIGPIQVIII